MKSKAIIILTLLLLPCMVVVAQSKGKGKKKDNNPPATTNVTPGVLLKNLPDSIRPNIMVLARTAVDSVTLRWAPDNFIAWKYLNNSGYNIMRYDITEEKSKYTAVKLNDTPVKPWKPEEWRKRLAPDNKYAPVALQAAFGKQFVAAQNNANADLQTMKDASTEQEMRWSLALFAADMDAPTAEALGLRWVDKTTEKNKKYVYYIIPLTDSIQVDSGFASVDMAVVDQLPTLPAPDFEEGEEEVKVWFDISMLSNFYSGYYVERSDNNGNTWKKLNNMPLVKATTPGALNDRLLYFTDTTVVNYKPYKYRLVAITPFGEACPPGPEVKAIGRDKTPPPQADIKEAKSTGNTLKVKWEYNFTPPGDFKGFFVLKALHLNDPFVPIHNTILKPNLREFIDTASIGIEGYYYVIHAVDTAGNYAASMPLFNQRTDSVPPANPQPPKGTIDTLGVVKLHWKMGKEKDLLGYRVFYANAPDHEFTNITPEPIRDTTYIDTVSVRTLTARVYYKIVAVDVNFNHSNFSPMLTIKRPDKIVPPSPLFSNYYVTDSTVVLAFTPSSAKDVAKYTLYRKETTEKEWKQVKEFTNIIKETLYTDRDVKGPAYYQYSIEAIDSAGNKSVKMEPVQVRVFQKLKKEIVTNFTAKYNQTKNSVTLIWKKPKAEVKYYVISRSINGKPATTLQSPEGTVITTDDFSAIAGGDYKYYIKAVYLQGGQSPIAVSNQIVVAGKNK